MPVRLPVRVTQLPVAVGPRGSGGSGGSGGLDEQTDVKVLRWWCFDDIVFMCVRLQPKTRNVCYYLQSSEGLPHVGQQLAAHFMRLRVVTRSQQ